MITWRPPARLGRGELPLTHVTECRRGVVIEDVLPAGSGGSGGGIEGRERTFVVSIPMAKGVRLGFVRPTSLEEAKRCVEEALEGRAADMMAAAQALREDVAVLYVDPLGPYPGLVREWYDEARDAKTYDGVGPVVPHPPCGPWGPLQHLNEKQDPSCGPHAVEVVRRCGGVLEHPKGSKLWEHCGLPKPGELPDAWGGVTFEVAQVDWGHVSRKRTWIYVVGARAVPSNPPHREPTHWCSGFRTSKGRSPKHYKANGSAVPPGIKVASAQQRRRTPVDFAKFLIGIASGCTAPPLPGTGEETKR